MKRDCREMTARELLLKEAQIDCASALTAAQEAALSLGEGLTALSEALTALSALSCDVSEYGLIDFGAEMNRRCQLELLEPVKRLRAEGAGLPDAARLDAIIFSVCERLRCARDFLADLEAEAPCRN